MEQRQKRDRGRADGGSQEERIERRNPGLSDVAADIERLLETGDGILASSLSTNSQQFISQMRQEGGQ